MKPRLTDQTILQLIEELRPQHRKLTGLRLRTELRQRYGHPGGVSRIYRLLKPQQIPTPLPATNRTQPDTAQAQKITELEATLETLRNQLTETLARAERAEHREQAHQDKWALEIHTLREQIRRLGATPIGRGG